LWSSLVGLLNQFLNFLYQFTVSIGFPNYGLAIILFTVIVRVIMFPLSLKQAKMTKNMQLLQPRVQQLQQQYKNSPEILNREIASLYKKYNANPVSGCLPLLIQMPILFALFSVLRDFKYDDLYAGFLWISNLSEPDKIYLPIIVAITSYVQSKITMASQPPQAGSQAKTMNIMMLYAMPLWIGWLSRTFAAGLSVYWVTFNTFGALQQLVMNSIVNRTHEQMKKEMEEEERKEAEARAAKAALRAANQKKAPKKVQKPVKQLNQKKKNENRGKALDFDD
jgi:YidC/Oxa1 family membrane protein insertase